MTLALDLVKRTTTSTIMILTPSTTTPIINSMTQTSTWVSSLTKVTTPTSRTSTRCSSSLLSRTSSSPLSRPLPTTSHLEASRSRKPIGRTPAALVPSYPRVESMLMTFPLILMMSLAAGALKSPRRKTTRSETSSRRRSRPMNLS